VKKVEYVAIQHQNINLLADIPKLVCQRIIVEVGVVCPGLRAIQMKVGCDSDPNPGWEFDFLP